MSELRSGLLPSDLAALADTGTSLEAPDVAELRRVPAMPPAAMPAAAAPPPAPTPPATAPPPAPAAAGATDDDAPLTPAESAKLARIGRGELEIAPLPAAVPAAKPPSTGQTPAAAPAGQPDAVPPIPPGFRPHYDPFTIEQEIAKRAWEGVPTGDLEEIAKRIREGDMQYINDDTGETRWLQMPGGVKSRAPAIAGATAQATATGTAVGEAPYKTVTIERINPITNQPEKIMMAGDDAKTYLHAQPPAGAGAGAPTPGVSVPTAGPGDPEVSKIMGTMLDRSRVANNGISEAKQLQSVLEQIGNVGPGTGWAGQISAILSRAGFTPAELKAAGLPDASNVYMAQKLSTDLMMNRAKESFQRVTDTDLNTTRAATPGADMPLGASRQMLGNVVIPQLWREAQRYSDLASNRQNWESPAAFHQAYAAWDSAHPLENYMLYPELAKAAPAGAPGSTPGAAAPPGSTAPAATVAAPPGAATTAPRVTKWVPNPQGGYMPAPAAQ